MIDIDLAPWTATQLAAILADIADIERAAVFRDPENSKPVTDACRTARNSVYALATSLGMTVGDEAAWNHLEAAFRHAGRAASAARKAMPRNAQTRIALAQALEMTREGLRRVGAAVGWHPTTLPEGERDPIHQHDALTDAIG